MSKWITDRRPTAEDADENGGVIAWIDDCWSAMRWQRVADEGLPWMHCPEPYVPPIDTSLAASIGRMEKASEHEYRSPQEYGADLDRIIEAAKKWDAMANQGKCVQGFSQSYGVKCSKCGVRVSLPITTASPGVFEIDDLNGWSFTTDDGWRCPNCQSSCGPSVSEPGASSPVTAGSSRSVGEAELLDPGEGYRLLKIGEVIDGRTDSFLERERNVWQDTGQGGYTLESYHYPHRRRVVMTEPPSVEWPSAIRCWRYDLDEKIWVPSDTDVVRKCWKSGETLAWCHRFEDETDPPQFALDWAKERP